MSVLAAVTYPLLEADPRVAAFRVERSNTAVPRPKTKSTSPSTQHRSNQDLEATPLAGELTSRVSWLPRKRTPDRTARSPVRCRATAWRFFISGCAASSKSRRCPSWRRQTAAR